MTYEQDNGMEFEMEIDAPREEVFDLISSTDRWTELITCITDGEVLTDHAQGEGVKLHWTVTVGGIDVDVWEMIDGWNPPEEFTWTSLERSKWNHEGAVRFEETEQGTTRVYTYMHYDLPRVVDNRLTRPIFVKLFQREIARSFGQVGAMLEAEKEPAGQ